MKRRLTMLLTAVAACTLVSTMTVPAATEIKKISVKVSAKLTLGETLPNISIRVDKDADVYVDAGAKTYQVEDAEWISSTDRELKIGDEPRMRVYLSMVNEDENCFKKTYSSSTVSVSKGTFQSVDVDGDQVVVELLTEGVKGTYDAPDAAWWDSTGLGYAAWDRPDVGTGTYEVQLFCGKSSMYKNSALTGTSFNFYPYMTKAGDYTFKVRTVPTSDNGKKYGTKSDWMESSIQTVSAEYVSDGSGQTKASSKKSSSSTTSTTGGSGPGEGSVMQAGWLQQDGVWRYRMPDGTYEKDRWKNMDGVWYRFDSTGRMMTGWYNESLQKKFYFNADGSMAKGWVKIGSRWRYFIPDGASEGMMYFNNWLVQDGKTYFMDEEGMMVVGWKRINGGYYYFYPKDDKEGHKEGQMAQDTVIEGFYVDVSGNWRQ